MSDYISRQAAIDAYGDWYVEEGPAEGFIGTVKQLLEGLPSAQPERKKGKWKRKIVDSGFNADWICSECGHRLKTEYATNYCPNCGADMRERRTDG